MKKILIASILSASIITTPASSSEMGFDMLEDMSGTSGLSVLSIVSVAASPLLSSAAVGSLLKDLSTTKNPITVNKIEQRKNGRTYIQGSANGEQIEFETPTKAVKQANLQSNASINVRNAKIGYVLESNNVALGIVPTSGNPDDFKQNKVN